MRKTLVLCSIALLARPSFLYPQTKSAVPPGALGILIIPVLLLLAIGLYFLPTIVAKKRKVQKVGGVVVVNFFLGWTLIGWVVALAWAVSGTPAPRQV